jgi:hypothetical protein
VSSVPVKVVDGALEFGKAAVDAVQPHIGVELELGGLSAAGNVEGQVTEVVDLIEDDFAQQGGGSGSAGFLGEKRVDFSFFDAEDDGDGAIAALLEDVVSSHGTSWES